MKKWLSILLVLALALGICACGGAAQPAAGMDSSGGTETAADAQGGTEAAEPEKVYVTRMVNKLVRMTEGAVPDYLLEDLGPVSHSGKRVTEYAYDEFGEPAGETVSYLCILAEEFLDAAENAEWRDDVTVERDDAGNLISVSKEGEEVRPFFGTNGWTTTETGTFENGVLTHIERVGNENGTTVATIDLEYHPNGVLSRETTKNQVMESAWTIYTFESPLVSIREFNEDGRCTLLHNEDINLDTDELRLKEYSWQYDAKGNPVSMAYQEGTADNTPMDNPEITYKRSAEMQYDAQNRMVSSSVLVNEDPNPVDFVYHYASDGRLSGYDAKTGEQTQKAEYEYGENGLLAVNHFTNNGSTRDIVYTWEEDEYGWLEGTNSDGSQGVFQYSDSMTIYPDLKDDGGNVTRESRYELMPSLVSMAPVYVEFEKEYDYDKVSIKVEVDPAELAMAEAQAGAVEDFYPPLPESVEGISLPVSDGAQRLISVTMRTPLNVTLPVVTELVYAADGELAGTDTYFAPVLAHETYWSEEKEADEQGRLIKYVSGQWVYEYVYGNDPSSYMLIITNPDGETSEREVFLADWQISDLVNRPPEDGIYREGTFDYNEDGLPIHSVFEMEYASGEKETREKTYTYFCETRDDGSVKNVVRQDSESEYKTNVYSFDEHGCLTNYTCYFNPNPSITFEYEYETAG